ncbi:unnamed protein product [Lasius platythorax]|uniref:Uncharacterized protein n=1 Tax=Lasius platythorax TaxID=488582 RepID=A0AAV2NNJ9_9HYME
MEQMEREDDDFGDGYIAESHPLRPTHLTIPLDGRSDSRTPSISSSVTDLNAPIYTRETTIPLSARKLPIQWAWKRKSRTTIFRNRRRRQRHWPQLRSPRRPIRTG